MDVKSIISNIKDLGNEMRNATEEETLKPIAFYASMWESFKNSKELTVRTTRIVRTFGKILCSTEAKEITQDIYAMVDIIKPILTKANKDSGMDEPDNEDYSLLFEDEE